MMPAKAKPEPAATQNEPFFVLSLLTDWTRKGTETFFASQRILWDLVTRQNATTMTAVRERLATVRTAPVAALTEMVGGAYPTSSRWIVFCFTSLREKTKFW